MKPIHPLIAVVLLLCSAGLLRADSTNMQEVSPGRSISLATYGAIDLSTEGAVEFWYRHQGDHAAQKSFAQDKFVDDAYSIVLTLGVGADLKAAVIVGPGTDGTASVGVLNDVSVLGNNENTRKQIVRLSKVDDFGKRDPIEFVKGSTYHILLAQRPGRKDIRVFVNGQLQGTLPATFGDGTPISVGLGWDPQSYKPATRPANDGPAEPVVYPFNGFIGGLRFWRTGQFEEIDALRLAEFGRLVDLADLTMIPEYGHLTAYADFVGRRWNASRSVFTTSADPVLRLADPLAGTWIVEGAVTHQTRKDTSVFDDYPVFHFLPKTPTLPNKAADRAYNVYEDGNFIGVMSRVPNSNQEFWKLNHYHRSSSKDGLVAEHIDVGAERLLKWTLTEIKGEKPFAGVTSGEVRMKRRHVADYGIRSPAAGRISPTEAKLRAQNDALQLVFLYQAYPKFFSRLYGSYNIVKMDPWNLFETGVATDDKVLRVPEADQMFRLNLSEQMILPYDLEVVAAALALDSSSTTLVSNASEYNAAITDRIGAGVSGSVSVGTGPISPVSVQGTVNLSVVVQYEAIREMAGTRTDSVEKLLRNRWEKKHALLHRKEAMRISDKYAEALRSLHGQLSGAAPQSRQQLVYAFFDKWGTHYPLAMVFGNLELTETTVTDRMRSESSSEQSSLEVTVNDGKSGTTHMRKGGNTEQIRDATTVVRSFGDAANPVPIALDLRPLTDLMTPQHFPDEPQIYTELRAVLATALVTYRNDVIAGAVRDLKGPASANAAKVLSELTSPPPPPPPAEVLAVRYKGISIDDWTMTINGKAIPTPVPQGGVELTLDGTIQFWPAVANNTPMIEMPAALRPRADAWIAANPPVDIFARTAVAEQVRRVRLGTAVGVQPFGDPKNTEILVRVPADLKDHAFIHVASWFQTTAPNRNGKGESINTTRMLICELARAEHPTTNVGPLRLPFDAILPDAQSISGTVLWASPNPAKVDLRANVQLHKAVPITAGPKSLRKDRVDPGGEKYFFKYPSPRQGWRTGKAPVKMNFDATGTLSTTIWIHYEYALLADLRDALAVNKNILPKDAWGTFSPGAKTPEVNPLEKRSARSLMAPHSAPLPAALLDQLNISPTLPLTSHFLLGSSSTLMPRGFGAVEFLPSPAAPCWTLIERKIGQWMIVNTLDGRALSVTATNVVACVAPRDGDDSQLWIPKPVGNGYELRNKRNGMMLAHPLNVKMPVVLMQAPEKSMLTTINFSPAIDLTPNSQLKIAADPAKIAALTDQLAAALNDARQPLTSTDPAILAQRAWKDLQATWDLNHDGKVDAAEARVSPIEGLLIKPYTDFEKQMFDLFAGRKADGQTDQQLKDLAENLTVTWSRHRITEYSSRLFKLLDIDSSGSLDPVEAAPILAMPPLKGATFDGIEPNPKDGKLLLVELVDWMTTFGRPALTP